MSVSEVLNLPTAEQQQELIFATKAMANSIADVAKKDRPFDEPREWRTVQSLVRLGLAPQFFQVGGQLQCNHETYGTLTWDILDFDYDIPCDETGKKLTTIDGYGNTIPAHSMTLQLDNSLNIPYKYNQREHIETGTSLNNWRDSDVRAWLNTDGIINEYSADSGFLKGLDSDLTSVVSYCTKSTMRNTRQDGGNAVLTTEKFFLPSATEVFARTDDFATVYKIPEGAALLSEDTVVDANKIYYSMDTSNVLSIASVNGTTNPKTLGLYEIKSEYSFYGAERSDHLSPSQAADTNRKKLVGALNYEWWVRTPNITYLNYSLFIRKSGEFQNTGSGVSGTFGIAPCCVIA